MTELSKTMLFVAVAAVSLLTAYASQPASIELDTALLIGKTVPKAFAPEDARRLKIVRFDEATATLSSFEVAQKDGLWTIPSHSGYPADAAQQMAEAATSVMDREILRIATENAADHAEYGVIDPTSNQLSAGDEGVGIRVTMADKNDDGLADLIIGKQVRDQEGQRYIREANRDIVYVVEIDPNKLSTEFADWIEDDLLQLNTFDVRNVDIRDYSATLATVLTGQGLQMSIDWDRRANMNLAFDNSGNKWSVNAIELFDPQQGERGEFVSYDLAANEELNSDKLNGLKTALDDLKIIDVERKPAGLSGDLKAGEDFLNNREAVQDLMDHGFAPVTVSGNSEILSSEGEIICTLATGVEYVLRFGKLQLRSGAAATESTSADADGDEQSTTNVNRYLFVMARLNEETIEQPELEDLPELPEGVDEASLAATSDDGAANADEETVADGPDASTDAAADTSSAASDAAVETADDDEDSGGEKDALSEIIEQRKTIEKENQRKLDDYKSKIEEGQKKVDDLNLRFGDWYFLIAEDVYAKIHLGKDDVIRATETEEAADEGAASESDSLPNTGASDAATGIPDLSSIRGLEDSGADPFQRAEASAAAAAGGNQDPPPSTNED